MDYEKVTVQDCLDMQKMKGQETVLNDGKVEGFNKEQGPLDALIIKDWLKDLVEIKTRMKDICCFDSGIRTIYPDDSIHISCGIDRISDMAGIELVEKETNYEDYPYRYSFEFMGMEFYQLSEKRLFTGIPEDTQEKAG